MARECFWNWPPTISAIAFPNLNFQSRNWTMPIKSERVYVRAGFTFLQLVLFWMLLQVLKIWLGWVRDLSLFPAQPKALSVSLSKLLPLSISLPVNEKLKPNDPNVPSNSKILDDPQMSTVLKPSTVRCQVVRRRWGSSCSNYFFHPRLLSYFCTQLCRPI